MNAAPDPMESHPVAGQRRVVFLKPLVGNPNIEVGDYSYYDDPDDPLAFERDAVLYAYGPERLIIGRYCAIASGVRFLLPGANHADLGPSTFPFGIFGSPWSERTMELVMSGRRWNPARVVRRRFDEENVARLLRAAWWDGPVELVTEHARVIMAGEPAELERIAAGHGLIQA